MAGESGSALQRERTGLAQKVINKANLEYCLTTDYLLG